MVGASLCYKATQSASFIPVVMKVAGLKTYRGAKRKEQFGVRLNGWRCVDITVQAPHKEKQEPAIDINIEPWTV